MPPVLKRASARLLESKPNYLEGSALIAVAAAMIFFKPKLWSYNRPLCLSVVSAVTVFLYACLGKGRIFTYLGWVALRRNVYCLYALLAGVAGAVAALLILRGTGLSVGSAPANRLCLFSAEAFAFLSLRGRLRFFA